MSLDIIKKHIQSREYSNLYLFYGEEDFLKEYYLNMFKDSILDKGFEDFNYSVFSGAGIDYIAAWDSAEALPVMSEYKLVLIKNSGTLKAPKALEKDFWESKLKDIPPQTIVVFFEKEVDKRGKLFKYISKEGKAFEFQTLKAVDLANWINRSLASYNKKMLKDDIYYLIEHCDTGMHNIKNEIDKLVNYCKEKEVITRVDIDELCIKSAESRVFQMIDCIMDGKLQLALKLLSEMMILKEPVIKILTLISRHFSGVYKVKLMIEQGIATSEMAKRIGVAPFVVTKYIAQARRFSKPFIKAVMQECLELDARIKSSSINDWIALETFIIHASDKQSS